MGNNIHVMSNRGESDREMLVKASLKPGQVFLSPKPSEGLFQPSALGAIVPELHMQHYSSPKYPQSLVLFILIPLSH